MKILIACEYSGAVREAFKELGHDVLSCDIKPSEIPGNHYQGDVMDIIHEQWDMMIAFPPCTHLAVSGAKHFEQKRKDGRQQQGINFFMKMINANIPKIAVENPIGIMSKIYRKPDQIIQPYHYGHEASKSTCLWLKELPLLIPTKIVDKGKFSISISGKKIPTWYSNNKKLRDRTFQGIANAMAEQWSIAK